MSEITPLTNQPIKDAGDPTLPAQETSKDTVPVVLTIQEDRPIQMKLVGLDGKTVTAELTLETLKQSIKKEMSRFKDETVEMYIKLLVDTVSPVFKDEEKTRQEKQRLSKELTETFEPQSLVRIGIRINQMKSYHRSQFDEMKNSGASPYRLLKFLAAHAEPNETNPVHRDTIYQEWMKFKHERQQEKLKGVAVRSSFLALTGAAMAFVVPYMVTQGAPVMSLTAPAWSMQGVELMTKPLQMLWTNIVGDGIAAPAAVGLATWMFLKKSLEIPNLQEKIVEDRSRWLELNQEKEDLMRRKCFNALRHIPNEDYHLLGHFEGLELRQFLLGDYQQRHQMLLNNPPTWVSMLKSIMCQHQSIKKWPALGWEVFKGSLPGLNWFKWSEWSMEKRLLEWDSNVPEGPLLEKRLSWKPSIHTLGQVIEDQEKEWKKRNEGNRPAF